MTRRPPSALTPRRSTSTGSYSCRGRSPSIPATMEVVDGDFEARARRVFDNLAAVARAAGGTLDDVVKLTVFLTDLGNFATVNAVMEDYFHKPFPARAAVGVASLPKGVDVEADAILSLNPPL